MSSAKRLAAIVLLVTLVASSLIGCSPKGPAFVDAGNAYTLASADSTATPDSGAKPITDAYASADLSKVSGTAVSEAERLRHAALVGLRSRGGDAAKAADLITRSFPADTRGVPVYVERAMVGDQQAFIIIEAAGPAGGKLSAKRMWVISENGDVLYAGTR